MCVGGRVAEAFPRCHPQWRPSRPRLRALTEASPAPSAPAPLQRRRRAARRHLPRRPHPQPGGAPAPQRHPRRAAPRRPRLLPHLPGRRRRQARPPLRPRHRVHCLQGHQVRGCACGGARCHIYPRLLACPAAPAADICLHYLHRIRPCKPSTPALPLIPCPAPSPPGTAASTPWWTTRRGSCAPAAPPTSTPPTSRRPPSTPASPSAWTSTTR